MGIFTLPTTSVRNTRIYVSASHETPGTQLTLYKNEVNTPFPGGYMILPVPYPQTLRFHPPPVHPPRDIPYLDFLDRVEAAFDHDYERDRYRFRNRELSRYANATVRYEIEVMDSFDHLVRFNNREHILHSTTMDELRDIYRQSFWGFILCKLLEGDYIYEPICYSHQTIGNELFIPSLIYQPRSFHDIHIDEESDRFDDRYFINGAAEPQWQDRNVWEVNPTRTGMIPWQVLPRRFASCLQLFLTQTRRGHHYNRDLFYEINPSLYTSRHSPNRRYRPSWDSPPPSPPNLWY